MKEDVENYKTAVETLNGHLERLRLRKTPERYEILRRALEMPGHFSPFELHRLMEREGFHVSRSTIYNTLELLCDCGLLWRQLLSSREARYERAGHSHCHLVCSRCGSVTEVEDSDLDKTLSGLNLSGFRPAYLTAVIHGICPSCLSQARASGQLNS